MIKNKLFFIGLCYWFFMLPIVAQNIIITGVFEPKDMSAAYVAVLGNMGQQNLLGESKVVEGAFSINLPQNTPQGIYKFAFGMQEKVYFYWVHTGESAYRFVFKNIQNKWRMECMDSPAHKYLTNYIQKEDSLMESMGVLYFFAANYPEKESKLFTNAQAVLQKKTKDFKDYRATAIAKAPQYCQEILTQTQVFLYNPLWDNATLEQNYEDSFYNQVPITDSTYYKKPFFGDKLEKFFSRTIEDKTMPEAEKYLKIKNKVLLTIEKLASHPQKNKYYNLMIRYFANVQYPQIIPIIDTFLDKNKLLTPEDGIALAYRINQKELIGKKAPSILTTQGEILAMATTEKKYLVFVGDNTPFSSALLQQLNTATQNKPNVQVTTILFTDKAESIQNFKNLFPTWQVHTQVDKTAEETIKNYYLIYAPTIFELNKDNTIIKSLEPFEKVF